MTGPTRSPVFFDPSGRRRRAVNRASLLLGLAAGVAAVLFATSLLVAPFVRAPGAASAPLAQGRAGSLIAPRRARVSRHLVQMARAELAREIERTRPRRGAAPALPDTLVAAFYVTWQPGGLGSLADNADRLTAVMPEWLHVARTGAGLDLRDWDTTITPGNARVVRIADAHRLDILPILNNAEARRFDPERAALLLRSPERRRAVARAVRDYLETNGFDGVNLDFEALHPEDYLRLPEFVADLKSTLPESLSVSVDIEASLDPVLVGRIANIADFVILMAYAQNGPDNEPGPLSALPWFDSVLTRLSARVPPGKLVVGIGNYGVDWTRDVGGVPVAVHDAWVTARQRRPGEAARNVLDFDDALINPTFVYRGDTTDNHEVWFLDAVTAYNQLRVAQRQGAIGTALWVLGSEDPSLWRIYDRNARGALPPPGVLDTIKAPNAITYTGAGELLTIAESPRDGRREIQQDSVTGFLTDETYHELPSSFVVHRTGYQPGLLALTFDDGPDAEYTDEIVDSLDALGVPGTFFLVGENVERFPDVVRRITEHGNEIGNHTFTHPNMAVVGRRRAELEMNATQRAIESVIGHSTTLFRVPYNVDAEPQFGEDALPLIVASSLGYITVGELLDPQDWNLLIADSVTGRSRLRTAQDIVNATIDQVHGTHGNVILLHSAGGDRSRTVKALPQIVRRLEDEGYRFVPVSALIGVPRESIEPPVRARDVVLVGLDRVTFEALDFGEQFLTVGFLVVIALALLRFGVVVPLALASRRQAKRLTYDPAFRPPVSVLIAAYNEATVIERTVRAALASHWPDIEVVVVDDGSLDGTGDVVAAAFAGDARVRLLRQDNAGKAAALNAAILAARHEILVGFDADTQVEPGAIGLLARHFADPAIAAVAGNVKVGNRVNTLTVWQSIEYISSQNLDRRAYAMLNAVAVVPGAIGAWRRAALTAVGGYVSDTLAEDMDLTWRLRRAGWRIAADTDAIGWTEAPETFGPFLKQRFRWAFGSLQVLWKHKGALGRYGWFGCFVLPAQWLFNVVFQILAPVLDLRLLYAVLAVLLSMVNVHQDAQPLPQLMRILGQAGFFYSLFFAIELCLSMVAFRLDGEEMKQLWWLFWQRFVYRQTMYYVVWKALVGAAKGKRQGWGKLQRTGTVSVMQQRETETVTRG